MSSRSCFILAVAALLAGCGRGRIDSSTGSAQFETTSASRALGLDPLPLPPPPPPPPAPSLTPIVIVEEPIPQAPVAPPTIASVPLGLGWLLLLPLLFLSVYTAYRDIYFD